MEIGRRTERMYFQELQQRLIVTVRNRLRNGQLTERSLARLTGISQPHVHNVLKGARILSPKNSDEILRRLRLTLLDLFEREEILATLSAGGTSDPRCREIPVLEGRLGPGWELPEMPSPFERYAFPSFQVASLTRPALARLAADADVEQSFRAGDMALLDYSAEKRAALDPDAFYVVARGNQGRVRRLRLGGRTLYLVDDRGLADPAAWQPVSLAGTPLLEVVRAKVVWVLRNLESEKTGTAEGETQRLRGGIS